MNHKFFLIGDSTMDRETSGWGGQFHQFTTGQVVNSGKSGRSTKSYISEGHWQKVAAVLAAGDYLFIQFGHNDQKLEDLTRGTYPFDDYQKNLRTFVETARKKGAKPVLLTPVQRRTFNDQGKIENSLGDYPKAMKELAATLDVPLLDIGARTKKLYERLGQEASKSLFSWYDTADQTGAPDNTHFNEKGATEVSQLVAEAFALLHAAKSIDK
ncbi:MAG: rhamnogalacturonan acetylesterase [Turicibacter sp.]|nr:rhamnogalacturonan acetylesterase [Turicibacter sp.]